MKPAGRRVEILLVAIVALIAWLPRGLALNRFVTTDEVLWLTRSGNFYYALIHRDYKNTFQREHPGVTVMWAGTLGFLVGYPQHRGSGVGQLDYFQFHDYLQKQSIGLPLQILAASRAFLVLGQILVLAFSFWYTLRLIGKVPALLAFLLISFDPFYLGLSRLLHLDALLAGLMLLSLLSFLAFLFDQNWVDLVISGLVAGLAFLTKSPAILLLPVVGLLSGYMLWSRASRDKEETDLPCLRNATLPVFTWLIAAVGAVYLFWPALWQDPLGPLGNVFAAAQNYASSGHDTAVFFNGHIFANGKIGNAFFYFYPLSFLWRTTPVVLIGLAATAFGLILRYPPFDRDRVRFTTVAVLLLAGIFTLVLTLGEKKFDRYFLPVHLLLDFLASLGWVFAAQRLIGWIGKRTGQNAKWLSQQTGLYLILGFIAGIQIYASASTFPYYLSYYDPWMGGGTKAPQVMQIGWGEGLDQAARYLNQKPIPENMNVASWYFIGPFSYFFQGHAHQIPIGLLNTEKSWSNFLANDYAVVYIHQQQRGLYSKRITEYLAGQEPEYVVRINGIEYVRVYALH
jgi:4-amino-4-deoxy-L-arabinose transferase-like glycosyltransferase